MIIVLDEERMQRPRPPKHQTNAAAKNGKSTLLRILATLLRPHAGDVLVFGEPLPRRAFAVRSKLGLLAHEPLLYRELTAAQNLRYHARLHGVAEQRIAELLDAVAMSRRADEPLRTLSRGMVQRTVRTSQRKVRL